MVPTLHYSQSVMQSAVWLPARFQSWTYNEWNTLFADNTISSLTQTFFSKKLIAFHGMKKLWEKIYDSYSYRIQLLFSWLFGLCLATFVCWKILSFAFFPLIDTSFFLPNNFLSFLYSSIGFLLDTPQVINSYFSPFCKRLARNTNGFPYLREMMNLPTLFLWSLWTYQTRHGLLAAEG